MKQLPRPENQTAEILNLLLHRKGITRREIIEHTDQLNPTCRLTELRKQGLEIPCKITDTINKFGNHSKYGTWSLTPSDQELGIKIYDKINGKKSPD
jgi:hypothetical protein